MPSVRWRIAAGEFSEVCPTSCSSKVPEIASVELLRSVDGNLTVGDYVDVLARLVDRDGKHDGIPVRPPAEMSVRVMNLHQCKGLEAPFVFLVDPSGESDHDVDVHIDRSTDQPRGYLSIYGPKRSQ